MSDLLGVNVSTAGGESAGCWADTMSDTQDAKAGGGLTILVADDDPAIRTLAGGVLQSHGYKVLQAADGVEALEVAAQHSGPIHLLLTDLSMPRLDGWGLHRCIRNERPETTTLFMSGNRYPGLQPRAAFLPKPFTIFALIQKVNQTLNLNTGSAKSEPARSR